MVTNIYNDFPDIKEDLIKVHESINDELTTDESSFTKVVQSVFNKNSKMIRPALVLISSKYNKKVKEKAIDLAAAVEMMHVASLVHDDIIDEAKVRRSQPTINEEYDTAYAVICGDYLFSKAFELIFKTQDLTGVSLMGKNVTTMVFGEVEQYLDKYNEDITIDRYFSIIEKKTASFFSTSLALGAHLAKVKQKEIDLLQELGKNLGILFQIQDDLLDFKSEKEIGKSSMSDIQRGTYSLPVIIAMTKSSTFKNRIINNDFDSDYIISELKKNNALQQTDEYIDLYYEKTVSNINNLSNDEVKENLTNLLSKLINRKK